MHTTVPISYDRPRKMQLHGISGGDQPSFGADCQRGDGGDDGAGTVV
jgi:hypothetical protein